MKKNPLVQGFTLIEIIVIVGILAILAMILFPSLLNYTSHAKSSKDATNARSSYSEVQVAVELGIISESGSKAVGGGICSYIIVLKVVTEYSCIMKSGTYTLDENFQSDMGE